MADVLFDEKNASHWSDSIFATIRSCTFISFRGCCVHILLHITQLSQTSSDLTAFLHAASIISLHDLQIFISDPEAH